jgi:hypothetical protein
MPIRLRFVAGSDPVSRLIIARSQVCMPFTPSHVEAVRPDGKYVGQHLRGGMQARDPGYDAAHLAHDLFVNLPANKLQEDAFYAFLEERLGQPYDWTTIISHALPVNFHDYDHAICSATIMLALRAKAAPYLRWPTTVPAHLVSPRDVLLIVSCLVEVPH